VVVTEKTTSPKGKYLESLGWVDPLNKARSLNKERALYWISKGAKPSATAHNLLVSEKALDAKKIAKHHVSKKTQTEGSKAAPSAPAA